MYLTTEERISARKKSIAAYQKKRYDAMSAFLNAYKLERGCAKCGYKEHAVALDFNHITGDKKFGMAKCKYYSIKSIEQEIDKCEILCANCHRVFTHVTKH